MPKITVRAIVKSAVVSAFTIAAALIWKDVIVEVVERIVPGTALFHKVIAALLATAIAIFGIYAILATESEAEQVINKIKHMKK